MDSEIIPKSWGLDFSSLIFFSPKKVPFRPLKPHPGVGLGLGSTRWFEATPGGKVSTHLRRLGRVPGVVCGVSGTAGGHDL